MASLQDFLTLNTEDTDTDFNAEPLEEYYPDTTFNIPEMTVEEPQPFTPEEAEKVTAFLQEFFTPSGAEPEEAGWGRAHINLFIQEGLFRMGLYHLLLYKNTCEWTVHTNRAGTFTERSWNERVLNGQRSENKTPWVHCNIREDCLALVAKVCHITNGGHQYHVKLNYKFGDPKAQLAYMRKFKLERFGITE